MGSKPLVGPELINIRVIHHSNDIMKLSLTHYGFVIYVGHDTYYGGKFIRRAKEDHIFSKRKMSILNYFEAIVYDMNENGVYTL